jgi:perosamine synthetase
VGGGEVIVPSFSFISTANAVILAGAKPVFAEIEEESLGLDPEDVKKKINSSTKAILPMHYGGRVCKNINILRKIADEHNILLIEDNAESFGAKINGKLAGTIGHAGMISFCQNKIITTGEGGAIITNDKLIYERLILIRSHGRIEQAGVSYFESTEIEDYIEIGFNFRISSISAALGISQLKKIDSILNKRRETGEFYNQILQKIKDLSILPAIEDTEIVYQLYSILLNNPESRKPLQDFLLSKGIYSKIYFAPIHLKSYYQQKYGYKKGDLPKTEEISNRIMSLPVSLNFKREDQEYIARMIADYYNKL